MSFARYIDSASASAMKPGLALVTGGRSGIGKAIAHKLAEFPFIEQVLLVSRSIPSQNLEHPKFVGVAADIATAEGRTKIVDQVQALSNNQSKQLRFLIHSAGTIDPIKSILNVQEDEMAQSMKVNVQGPILLSTALYPYLSNESTPGRILHVSSGAAHGAPPVGWAVYGITKAAFYQAFHTLDNEFTHLGGKVRVGSFKPGIVDTDMQGVIRQSPSEAMPVVNKFQDLKSKMVSDSFKSAARPPPSGALDTPENVAFFAEWLLLGTSDDEFSNRNAPTGEYDIRNKDLYSKWIPSENIPKE